MTLIDDAPVLRGRWPLVGRGPLLARIAQSLGPSSTDHDKSISRPDVVVLCGPSGVGKTRAMEDFLTDLGADEHEGTTTLVRVAASRAAAAIPLAALADVLTDPHQSDRRGDGKDVVRGFPSTQARDPAALLADAHRVLARRARGGRLLLAVDDLPALDPMSVLVLTSLITAGSARMVATARDGEPLPDAVQTWWTSGRALRLDVAPLGLDDVATLLEQVLAGPVSPPTVAVLHQASAGMPLYLRELAAGAAEGGELVETAGVWRLGDERAQTVSATPGLRHLLLSRLDALLSADRDLLERLAVCATLRLGEFPTDVTEQVITLEANGLVEPVDPQDPDPLLRLAHPQLTAVLQERLPRLAARRLLLEHAALVEASPARREDTARTAQWRLAATGTGDPALLVRAARVALAAHDHASAERLADAALTPRPISSDQDADVDDTAVSAYLLRARAQWETGRPAAVLASLEQLDHTRLIALDDPEVAVLRATAIATDSHRLDSALETLIPARRAVENGERPDLAAEVVGLLLDLDHAGDAAALVDHHAGLARDAHDRAQADPAFTTAAALVMLEVGRVTDAVRHADNAIARARTAPTLTRDALLADALAARAKVMLEGEFFPEQALTTAREALTAAVEAGTPRAVYESEWTLARAANLTGDQQASQRWSRYILADALIGRHRRHRELGLVGVAFNAAESGDTTGLQQALTDIELSSPQLDQLPWNARLTALVRLVLHGDRRGAMDIVRRRAEAAEGRGSLLGAANDWFELAAMGRDEAVTRDAAERLRAIAGRSDSPLIGLYTDHVVARAARDLAGFSAVIDRWEQRHGMFYARRGAVEAVRIAREDGRARQATALTARFEAISRRCPQLVHPPLDQPARTPLTRREHQIAELAAADNSNVEIAATLVLSVRTVENHLANAYTKLGVTSRTELPAALHQ